MAEQIAKEFLQFYYEKYKLGGQRGDALVALYADDSQMTFEGDLRTGRVAIKEKLNSLTFKSIEHQITTMDFQPLDDSTLLIMVVGMLKTDNDPPHAFSQNFVLKAHAAGYYVKGEMFRMVLHNNAV